MIKKQSDDPDVALAASTAHEIISDTLGSLPPAEAFDYGGHDMKIGDYGVCETCTRPIAEAQAAHGALMARAKNIDDAEVREHIEMAAELLELEAHAATKRAELHNGRGSEKIIDRVNGFLHDRNVHDTFAHSHHGGSNE